MISTRLGVRLALSRDRKHRWRQSSIILSAMVLALVTAFSLCVVHASEDAQTRLASRLPRTGPGAVIVDASISGLILRDGTQASLMWVSPRAGHEHDPATVPPGLTRLPTPGHFVASAAMAHEMAEDGTHLPLDPVGTGPGGHIGSEGLQAPNERFLYGRPSSSPISASSGAEGFGAPLDEAWSYPVTPAMVTSDEALLGSAGFLTLPALVLLTYACRARSAVRRARVTTLRRMGISEPAVVLMSGTETGVLSLIGACLGCLICTITFGYISTIPITGTQLPANALSPGAASLSAALLFTTAWGMLTAAIEVLPLARFLKMPAALVAAGLRRGRPHRAAQPGSILGWMLGTGLMAVASAFPRRSSISVILLLAGLIISLTLMPRALHRLSALCGRRLAGEGPGQFDPIAWLTGRRLVIRGEHLVKVAAVASALLVIAGIGMSIRAASTSATTRHSADPAAYIMTPLSATTPSSDLAVARNLGVALPFDGHSFIAQSCSDLSNLHVSNRAQPCTGAKISSVLTHPLADLGIQVAVGKQPAKTSQFLVLLQSPTDDLHLLGLAKDLPGVIIDRLDGSGSSGGVLTGWVTAWWAAGCMLGGIALWRETVERVREAIAEDAPLRTTGIDPSHVKAVQFWSLTVPYLCAVPLALVTTFGFTLVGTRAGLTVVNIAPILMATVAAGAVSVIVIWVAVRFSDHV